MRAFVALLLLASAASAAPPTVEIPADLKPVGGYVIFTPKTDAKAVTYIALSGADPLPAVLLNDKRSFVLPVRGLADGNYRFVAVASLNDVHAVAEFMVPVGKPGPPVPPTPPVPPVPPQPDGPLRAKLRAAYLRDGGATPANTEARLLLVELYKQAVALSADPTITTRAALREKIKAAAAKLTADAIAQTRTAIRDEIASAIGSDGDLTATDRAIAARTFGEIAAALGW